MATIEPDRRDKLLESLVADLLRVFRRQDDEVALKLIQKALTLGLDGPAIYLGVFQPALERIGCFWEAGKLNVAEEHAATATTRWLMRVLWDEFTPSTYRSGLPPLLSGCVRGERHDLGLSMVSDFLRRDGWHVVDLGADTPEWDLATMAARIRPGVCLLSATRVESLDAVRAAIGELQGRVDGAAILVGGAVFARDPSLATTLGATGTAANAQDAVDWVRQYLHA